MLRSSLPLGHSLENRASYSVMGRPRKRSRFSNSVTTTPVRQSQSSSSSSGNLVSPRSATPTKVDVAMEFGHQIQEFKVISQSDDIKDALIKVNDNLFQTMKLLGLMNSQLVQNSGSSDAEIKLHVREVFVLDSTSCMLHIVCFRSC